MWTLASSNSTQRMEGTLTSSTRDTVVAGRKWSNRAPSNGNGKRIGVVTAFGLAQTGLGGDTSVGSSSVIRGSHSAQWRIQNRRIVTLSATRSTMSRSTIVSLGASNGR